MAESPSENGAGAGPQRVVASFKTYGGAEGAVDRLAEAGFPVEHAAIVGHDVRFVEQVTGRFGYGEAALRGAALASSFMVRLMRLRTGSTSSTFTLTMSPVFTTSRASLTKRCAS